MLPGPVCCQVPLLGLVVRMCPQLVVSGDQAKLNTIAFNTEEPVVIVGDSLVRPSHIM